MKNANFIDGCIKICAKWGLLPTAFNECMTWEEQVLWLARFLQEEVIPTVNENTEAFKELKAYVENYFENLDVQDEINNKLDEMLEDGDLSVAIAGVMDKTEIYPESYGAVGDGVNDDTEAIQAAIDYAYEHQATVRLRNATYMITQPLIVYGNPNSVGKGTVMRGNGIGNTTISMTTNTTKTDYAGNSFNACIIISKQDSADGGCHNIVLSDFSMQGNDVCKYGIASKMSSARSEFKFLTMHHFTDAGIYQIGNTYLNRYTQLRASYSTYGFYIFGGINTSDVIANCYSVVCTNGYKIGGIYMTMDSPCCDHATGVVFDLERYSGTVNAPGSESINADTVFRFGTSNCAIVGAVTFPNYDDDAAKHIRLNAGSHVVFIGGRLMYDGLGRNTAAAGGLLENGYLSDVQFQNVNIGAYTLKPTGRENSIQSSRNITTGYGTITTFGDNKIGYIGMSSTETQGKVNTGCVNEDLQATAIYVGAGYLKNRTFNKANLNGIRSPMLGDILLTKRPDEIGGIGWIQTGDATGVNWKVNTMKKIPIVQSGNTASRPVYMPEIGQSYYDTTLNKPVWVKSIGSRAALHLTITGAATADGTITITAYGQTMTVAITEGDTITQVADKIQALNDTQPTMLIYKGTTSDKVEFEAFAYKAQDAPTISVGDTGVTFTETHANGGNVTWVDATGTTV